MELEKLIKEILESDAKSEYKQVSIILLRNAFKNLQPQTVKSLDGLNELEEPDKRDYYGQGEFLEKSYNKDLEKYNQAKSSRS